jgi:peptide deformylase
MSSKVEKLVRTGDDPILKRVCDPLESADDRSFIDTMITVVKKYRRVQAVGLAAPQIGVAKRVIVTYCRDDRGSVRVRVMINPEITSRSSETEVDVEGCLSYPGIQKRIRRHSYINVIWQDDKSSIMRAQSIGGFLARVIQHEIDHLNGICRVGDDWPPDETQSEVRADIARVGSMLAVVSGVSMGMSTKL